MVRLLNKFLRHSDEKMKGLVEFLYLKLLCFLNYIYEQNLRITKFTSSKSALHLVTNKKSLETLSALNKLSNKPVS